MRGPALPNLPMEPSKMQMAIRHVIDGRRIVARQEQRVEMLARSGSDTAEAKRTFDYSPTRSTFWRMS